MTLPTPAPTPLDKILLTVLAVAAMFAAVMLAGLGATLPRPAPVAPVVGPVVDPKPQPSPKPAPPPVAPIVAPVAPTPKPRPTPAPLPVSPIFGPGLDLTPEQLRVIAADWDAWVKSPAGQFEIDRFRPGPPPAPPGPLPVPVNPTPTPTPTPTPNPSGYSGPLIGMLILPANESSTLAALRPPNPAVESAFASASATYRVANVDTLTKEMPGWSPIVEANGPAPVVVWTTPGKDGKVIDATRLDASASAAVNADAIVAGLRKVRGK